MKILCFIFIVLYSVPSFSTEKKEDDSNEFAFMMKYLYRDLKYIESFGFIHVHVKSKIKGKSENSIGLNDEDLTDYLRLRFKNNFANFPITNWDYKKEKPEIEGKKQGRLWCGVWSVGDDFPVAYHVECRLGNSINNRIIDDELLGYGNSDNVPGSIKSSLNSLVESFAIIFFKYRGEM